MEPDEDTPTERVRKKFSSSYYSSLNFANGRTRIGSKSNPHRKTGSEIQEKNLIRIRSFSNRGPGVLQNPNPAQKLDPDITSEGMIHLHPSKWPVRSNSI